MECLKDVSGHTISKYFTSEKFRSVYKLSTVAYFMALSDQFPGETGLNQDYPEE